MRRAARAKNSGGPLKTYRTSYCSNERKLDCFLMPEKCKKVVAGVFEKTNEDLVLLCLTVEWYCNEPSYNDFLISLKTFQNAILQF